MPDQDGGQGGEGGEDVGDDDPSPAPTARERVDSALSSAPIPGVTASSHLGFSLLRHLAKAGEGEVLISPHGLASALLLTWNGASGKTAAAISETVGLEAGTKLNDFNRTWKALDASLLSPRKTADVSIANSLWLRQDRRLVEEYVERAGDVFRARLERLDFSDPGASGVINKWVDQQTKGKIKSVVPDSIPPNVMLYVVNATHFKGLWSDKFDPADTEPRKFHTDEGKQVEVPMMRRVGRWSHRKDESIQAVRLPYGKGEFAMYVVVPPAGKLDRWLDGSGSESWEKLVATMKPGKGRVVLPRFRLGYDAKLRQQLSELGMEVAFGDGADFSGLSAKPVALSEVFHKAVIEVNEEGAEAAAATAVEAVDVAVVEDRFEIVVNRPFFFAIRHEESGALLFMGLVRSLK